MFRIQKMRVFWNDNKKVEHDTALGELISGIGVHVYMYTFQVTKLHYFCLFFLPGDTGAWCPWEEEHKTLSLSPVCKSEDVHVKHVIPRPVVKYITRLQTGSHANLFQRRPGATAVGPTLGQSRADEPPPPLSQQFPGNTRPWTNVDLMLAQRLWRWPNIKSTLVQGLVFSGEPHHNTGSQVTSHKGGTIS